MKFENSDGGNFLFRGFFCLLVEFDEVWGERRKNPNTELNHDDAVCLKVDPIIVKVSPTMLVSQNNGFVEVSSSFDLEFLVIFSPSRQLMNKIFSTHHLKVIEILFRHRFLEREICDCGARSGT
jgi:hypothetical protein